MWWDAMSAFQQTMFIIACSATAVLILQIVLMLVGGSNDADVSDMSGGGMLDDVPDMSGGAGDIDIDADGDGDGEAGSDGSTSFGLRLLSFRSIVAFTAMTGWVGYTLCYTLAWQYSLIIALACGAAAACLVAWAMLGFEKLQDNGNLDPANAIGAKGVVYLSVPPTRSGKGKINILIQERYAEYEAVTDDGDAIPTSAEVIVTGHVGDNVLLVKAANTTVKTEKGAGYSECDEEKSTNITQKEK